MRHRAAPQIIPFHFGIGGALDYGTRQLPPAIPTPCALRLILMGVACNVKSRGNILELENLWLVNIGLVGAHIRISLLNRNYHFFLTLSLFVPPTLFQSVAATASSAPPK